MRCKMFARAKDTNTFSGEVGDSFEPVADSVSVSSPLADDSPRQPEEEGNLGGGPAGMILNDSDDSL